MYNLTRVFLWGLIISFLGSLPLGTLNIAAMQIGIQENVTQAIYFSLGCLLVEMIYVRISLVGIEWVRKQEKLMKVMDWIAFSVILILALSSFYAAWNDGDSSKNIMLNNNLHRFLLGMFLCAINPVQIPFWFGWSTVLFSKNILQPINSHYNTYIVGIGVGTLLGNAVFIFGGKWLTSRISNANEYINWIIGLVFLITAILQLIKNLKKKERIVG